MIDFRVLALGAMALLMAVYGASSASGTSLKQTSVIAMQGDVSGPQSRERIVYVDGFDLRR